MTLSDGSDFALKPGWVCIRSQLKREDIAASNLKLKLGIEVFNPRLRVCRQTVRGTVNVIESLFPNYLFARFPLETCLDEVRYTPGVARVVQFGDRIPVIADAVMRDLQARYDESWEAAPAPDLLVGEDVKIASGPFTGLNGTVFRTLAAGQRVQLLLDLLGRQTMVEVERAALSREQPFVRTRQLQFA
jgi:transcriptional antiterminator RfaH